MNRMRIAWMLALVVMVATGCYRATQRQPYLVFENTGNAQTHMKAGRTEEAAQILQVILLAKPDDELARDMLAQLPVDITPLFAPSIQGLNLMPATPRRDVGTRILLYPVNRILDICDIVNVNLGPQGGVYVDLHATQSMALKAGGGGGAEIGWWQKRELAFGASHVAGFALGPSSAVGEGETRIGTRGTRNASYRLAGINGPYDRPFQRYHDYWGVGVRVIAAVVGVNIEFHPLEVADAILGFGTIDFLRDDFGSTRGLEFTPADRQAMDDLLDSLTKEQFAQNRRYLELHPVRPDLTRPTVDSAFPLAPAAPETAPQPTPPPAQ